MITWQTGKYATLMDLHNDAAKNYLWRSSTIITPRSGGSNSHHGKGKAPMTQPNCKRHQPIVLGLIILIVTTALDLVVVKVFLTL